MEYDIRGSYTLTKEAVYAIKIDGGRIYIPQKAGTAVIIRSDFCVNDDEYRGLALFTRENYGEKPKVR